jgi:uncharacterized protein
MLRSFFPLSRAALAPAALALALLAAPAQAQQKAAPAPAAPQAVGSPLMQKALETKFADSHIDLAAQVLKASGLGVMFQNAIPNVVGSLRVNVTRTRPELTKDIEESLKVVEADVAKVTDDGMKAAARFLAVRMSESELKEVLSFLNSTSGKKYVESLPGVTDDIVPFMEIWAPEVEGRLMKSFQEQMAKRGHKL